MALAVAALGGEKRQARAVMRTLVFTISAASFVEELGRQAAGNALFRMFRIDGLPVNS
jgi:hypothetical protein